MLLLEQRFYCSGFFGLVKLCEGSIVTPMLTEQSQSGKDAQENAGLKAK